MFRYAVEDTHYLLYIYDRVRAELAAKSQPGNSLVLAVFNRSRELCLQMQEAFNMLSLLSVVFVFLRYEKPAPVGPTSHEELFSKLRVEPLAAGPGLEALKELYRWRDELARQEDESPAFVLPNRMLFAICQALPSSVEQARESEKKKESFVHRCSTAACSVCACSSSGAGLCARDDGAHSPGARRSHRTRFRSAGLLLDRCLAQTATHTTTATSV